MTAKDWTAIAGAFLLAFGAKLKERVASETAWLIGDAMVLLGPLLMASRAMAAKKDGTPSATDSDKSPESP